MVGRRPQPLEETVALIEADGLRGGVGAQAWIAHVRADGRGDVDDRAAAVLAHVRDLMLHRQPEAGQVRRQHARPRGLVELGDPGPGRAHAGGVDGDIETAVRRGRGDDRTLDLLGARHVRDDRGAAKAIGLDPVSYTHLTLPTTRIV